MNNLSGVVDSMDNAALREENARLKAKLARVVEAFADCIYHHGCEGYEEEGVCEHTRALAAAKEE